MLKIITTEHVKKSIERTGKSFEEMHCWLDNCKFDNNFPESSPLHFINFDSYSMQHRNERHTAEGMQYVLNTWGPEALDEAIEHLREDGYVVIHNKFLPEETEKVSV